MRFEWDQKKDKINQRKHQISFTTATRVFEDPEYVSVQDREVDGENDGRRLEERETKF